MGHNREGPLDQKLGISWLGSALWILLLSVCLFAAESFSCGGEGGRGGCKFKPQFRFS